MVIQGDIYLKKHPILMHKSKKREVKDDFSDEDDDLDYVDKIATKIFINTGYEILFPEETSDNLTEKFKYLMNEIENEMSEEERSSINKYYLLALRELLKSIELGSTLEEIYEKIEKEKQLEGKDLYDYSGIWDFWVVECSPMEFVMRDSSCPTVMHFQTENELDKDFCSLRYFLNHATFIGREFCTKKPVLFGLTEDRNFMKSSDGTKYIILYATGDFLLIKRVGFVGHKDSYSILDERYIDEQNIELFGDVYSEYRDKQKLFQDIKRQALEGIELLHKTYGNGDKNKTL